MQHIVTEETDETLLLTLSVARIPFLDFNQKKNLLKNLDSPQSLVLQSIEDIYKLLQCQKVSKPYWNGADNLRMAKAEVYQCKRLGIKLLLYDDPLYPEALRQIADPPFLLFVRGNENLLGGSNVSVVGTRRLSTAGREAAKSFAYDAAVDGCNVVSGLAYGADACAHQGALDAFYDNPEGAGFGRTIAVLPCAIDEVVPYTNKRLAAQILQCGGCIISEYEPKLEMANWHFVGRNRIIAGLSPATLVIEAPAGSGALITADFAVEYDRDLFFHKSGFSQAAKLIAENTQCQLEADFAAGKVSKYKLESISNIFYLQRYGKSG